MSCFAMFFSHLSLACGIPRSPCSLSLSLSLWPRLSNLRPAQTTAAALALRVWLICRMCGRATPSKCCDNNEEGFDSDKPARWPLIPSVCSCPLTPHSPLPSPSSTCTKLRRTKKNVEFLIFFTFCVFVIIIIIIFFYCFL